MDTAFLTHPAMPSRGIDRASRTLYSEISGPAAKLIKRANRLLVCPDGPLHYLPFGALVNGKGRYVIEDKAISTVTSATVLKELRREKQAERTIPMIVAFGDPVYPKARGARVDAVARSAIRLNALTPLPATRKEVETIGALYPKPASIYLGKAATEARVKNLPAGVAYLHFACHGIIDERFSLDSGLVGLPRLSVSTVAEFWGDTSLAARVECWYSYRRAQGSLAAR